MSNKNDDLNENFILSTVFTELVVKIAKGEINMQEIAIKELKNRGLDKSGKFIGF